jgi:Catechol dioxygenase N terminus
MTNRGEQIAGELRRRITALVADFDVTCDEYQAAMQRLIEVGEAGEVPLRGSTARRRLAVSPGRGFTTPVPHRTEGRSR